jgi:ATP-dependent DNA helicase RecQ
VVTLNAVTDTESRARDLLRQALGDDAQFRDGQLEAITDLVDLRRRVLVVQRTGWGKSFVYFLATALLRERGAGPTILISPLLALMRDQVRMAEQCLRLRAQRIDNTNDQRWDEIDETLAFDQVDLLLVSPERLGNDRFLTRTLPAMDKGIGLLVVDEAHCISDWGHDFRPDYQRIHRVVGQLLPGVPVLATTATANDRVVADIEAQLGPDLVVRRGALARDSLYLQVIELPSQSERMAWLAAYLDEAAGSGIIYVLTIRDALRVSAWLRSRGIEAPAYHGDLDDEDRVTLEDRLRDNQVKALIATVALGMGFDKRDLTFVIHFQRPSSAVAYYQQIGRAGRATERAEVILLAGAEDDAIADGFRDAAFPSETVTNTILEAVRKVDETTVPRLEQTLNLRTKEIKQVLKVLEIEGAVARDSGHYFATVNPWKYDTARVSHVTEVRLHEQERMREYVGTSECLMVFLTSDLDDPRKERCGRCANCVGAFAPTAVEPELVNAAALFLRRAYRVIEPRKKWPPGIRAPKNTIPAEEQVEEGRALALYGDPGWGVLVKQGKYRDQRFHDDLVEAVAEMLDHWQPDPRPGWVTAIPSLRDPERVRNFARRVALRLGLEYRGALSKARDTPPQKQQQNSYQQATNVLGAFAADPDQVLAAPVLLIDDLVDSRWSMTVCGVQLRRAGAGPVFPLALAETTPGAS